MRPLFFLEILTFSLMLDVFCVELRVIKTILSAVFKSSTIVWWHLTHGDLVTYQEILL